MKYNFDEIYERAGSNAFKYDFREKLYGSNDLIPMWVADMDFKSPDFVINALKERLNHEILGYTLRPESFNDSIVDWMKKRHQWKIQKEWISFTPGVVPGVAMVVMAFTQPGDKIIIQTPVYHPFFSTIANNGRQISINKLINTNGYYTIDFEDLEKQIDARTKVILLSNPHNPVGRVWKKEELEKIGALAVKYNLLIFSDDIHSDLIIAPNKFTPIAGLSTEIAERCISFFAPSKTFNLAGLSTAVVISSNKKLLEQYNLVLDNMHLYMGNIFGNIALETAYRNGEVWLEELTVYLDNNMQYVCDFIEKNLPKIKVIKPEGTYLMWLDFREYGLSIEELNKKLRQDAKLALNSGEMFGKCGEGFQRMNVACPLSIVKKAMHNLKENF